MNRGPADCSRQFVLLICLSLSCVSYRSFAWCLGLTVPFLFPSASRRRDNNAWRRGFRVYYYSAGAKRLEAVGIENNNGRDFRYLRGMRRSANSLKRNGGGCQGTRVAPLKLPRISALHNSLLLDFRSAPRIASRLGAQISWRGWHAD